jgi:hypothetical protein
MTNLVPAPGSIVRLKRRAGLWVVSSQSRSTYSPGAIVSVFRDDGKVRTSIPALVGDIAIIAWPTFEPGERVTYRGMSAIVLNDDGQSTVKIKYGFVRQLAEGGSMAWKNRTMQVSRGDLAVDNLSKFI